LIIKNTKLFNDVGHAVPDLLLTTLLAAVVASPFAFANDAIGFALLAFGIAGLCFIANGIGYNGLLGVPHLLKEYWYDYQTEKMSAEERVPHVVDRANAF
jgi:hypothetical protein